MKRNLQSLLLTGSLFATVAFAGPAVVGVATAIGSFSVNDTTVAGTSNLTDGALLKTDGIVSQVSLTGGSHLLVGTNSAANIYSDKVILRQGIARVDNMNPSFSLEASSLRVANDKTGGQGAVRLNGSKVEVASVLGNMNVYNSHGALLARVAAGTVASIDDPQSGASSDQGSNNNKKNGTYVPSGATGGGTLMSNSAALWIALGLAGVGVGLGVGLSQQGSGSSSPQ